MTRIELEVHIHAESDKAIGVSLDGVEKHAHWIPKSKVDVIERGTGPKHHLATIALPEWLAKDRGFI